MATERVFQSRVPVEPILAFFASTTDKAAERYDYSKIEFKRGLLLGQVDKFVATMRPHYRPIAVQQYLNRPLTYPNFLTILRQLCRAVGILWCSETTYHHGVYDIVYHFDLSSIVPATNICPTPSQTPALDPSLDAQTTDNSCDAESRRSAHTDPAPEN